MTCVYVAVKSILVRCSWMIGDLDATRVSCGIVVDVEVRGFVESVQNRTDCRWRKVVMDICEAECGQTSVIRMLSRLAYTVTSRSSPGYGGMVVGSA